MNTEKNNEIKMHQAINNKHWEQDEDDFLSSTAINISEWHKPLLQKSCKDYVRYLCNNKITNTSRA